MSSEDKEFLSELYARRAELQAQARDYEDLIKSRGYARLVEVALGQVSIRREQSRTRTGGLDGMIEREWLLAEADGIELFAKLAESALESVQTELEGVNDQIRSYQDEPEDS